MKTLIIIFSSVIAFSLMSCSHDNESFDQQEKTVFNNEESDLLILKDFSKYVTSELYKQAYDAETGDIDLREYDKVILSYNFPDKKMDLSPSLIQPTSTRSKSDVTAFIDNSTLTQIQKEIFKELLAIEKPIMDDYEEIKLKVSDWDGEEKDLIIVIVNSIISINNGINEGLNLAQTRASAKSYVCNAGVSLISGVTGFLAGALTAPTGAGPLVGYIVGGAVSIYLGANMC